MDRLVHLLVIVSFFGLVMTGMPLHFAHEPWARVVLRLHGGIETAGVIHRTCAVIMFGYFFLHVGVVTARLWRSADRKRFLLGPDSMVPNAKDVADFGQMVRWFVGRGPMPRFNRYAYFEKVDYWAEFWGVAIIGGSGLLLWFPEFFAVWFPGWMFNVATIVHGIEALLAMCFIFTIHVFNGQLRPEKFPLDIVIFTGRATSEYMREEHAAEYERLERSGRLAERVAPPPGKGLVAAATILAVCAMGIGLVLVGLVIWAALP
jgi:cytochrome b subunit of formate dehydrogenase